MHASYSRAFARDSAAWQGWFEAPISATYMFMLRNDVDVTSTLTWSGDDSAAETETLAISGERSVSPPPAAPPLPALTRSATMSSIYGDWGGHRCIDGFRGGTSCHTLCNSGSEWLSIDLSGGQGVLMSVGAIQIYNRHVNQNRLDHHQIWVGTSATKFGEPALLCADVVAPPTTGPFEYDCGGMVGSHVTVLLPGSATHRRCLSLNEVVIDADVAPPPPPPAWPILSEDAASPAVSRPLTLIGGHRYWMQLECNTPSLPASSPSPPPNTPPTCEDTLGWNNGNSYTCSDYASRNWCSNEAPTPGQEWTTGQSYNHPENNCCVCGKSSSGEAVDLDEVDVLLRSSIRGGASCAVGTHIMAHTTPRAASLSSPTRRWQPRVVSSLSCSSIVDRATCCAVIDMHGDACVPAVTSFTGGAVCAGRKVHSSTEWSALQQASAFATCPSPATTAAQPRIKLAVDTPCSAVIDRVTCCSAIDGRAGTPVDPSIHEDAPCVPAVTAFGNGAACESASYDFSSEVEVAESAASCAELYSGRPVTTPYGAEAIVAHEMQQLTFSQLAPAKHTQQVTLATVHCDAGTNCVAGVEGTVSLQWPHQALDSSEQWSTALSVRATAAEVTAALLALPQRTYSDAIVSSIDSTNSTIIWTIELTFPPSACSSAPPMRQLFVVDGGAKMTAQTAITAWGTCLDGGLDISMPGSSTPAFLPADATPDVLTTALNTLLGATTAAEGVLVTRAVDSVSTATVFNIAFLSGGARPLLHVASAAGRPLLKGTYTTGTSYATTSTDVSFSVKRVASGGIELKPIPARYLSAPTDQIALRLRLASKTTARCAAPNWAAAHLGCFATNATDNNASVGHSGSARTFANGFSLERCALHCRDAADAVALGAELDSCTCLSAAMLDAARSACSRVSNPHTP